MHGGNWKLETGHCPALDGRGDAPTVSRATHPSKPEQYYPPAPRPEASRSLCAVFQFIHSRSFDASGQNPVSRIEGWGPRRVHRVSGGVNFQIPINSNVPLSVNQGSKVQNTDSQASPQRSGRGDAREWTKLANTDSKYQGRGFSHTTAHIFKRKHKWWRSFHKEAQR
jgi:hypothetical protein